MTAEDFNRAVAAEWQAKRQLGGREVADDRPRSRRQLALPF